MASRRPTEFGFTIVVDQREKLPFKFESAGVEVVTALLETGDYSILGMENRVAVERKRPVELFSNFTRDRDRFKREYERLAQIQYAAVVIEGDLPSCATRGSRHSRVSPSLIINSLISWSIRYNVHTWFATDRELAETLTFRILEKFFRADIERC